MARRWHCSFPLAFLTLCLGTSGIIFVTIGRSARCAQFSKQIAAHGESRRFQQKVLPSPRVIFGLHYCRWEDAIFSTIIALFLMMAWAARRSYGIVSAHTATFSGMSSHYWRTYAGSSRRFHSSEPASSSTAAVSRSAISHNAGSDTQDDITAPVAERSGYF